MKFGCEKFATFFGLLAAAFYTAPAHSQFEPNSDVYVMQDYFYPNGRGDQIPYRSAIVVQRPTETRRGEIRLLPNVYVLGSDVTYVSEEGVNYNYRSGEKKPATITIRPSVDVSPDPDMVWPKIDDALGSPYESPLRYPVVVPRVGNSTIPLMHKPITDRNFDLFNAIVDAGAPYIVGGWSVSGRSYSRYDFNSSQIRELTITLLVDGVVVATRSLPGTAITSGGYLPSLTILDPDLYTANRIRSGVFEVEAAFEISDSRVSTISANIDYQTVITSFIEQTRRVSTRSKSSGWKILGFGNRRRRLKTSIDEALRSENDVDEVENTTITMVDPTDDMVRRFEADFFPSVSRAEVVAAHQESAQKAADEGKPDLAKVHADYAAALLANEPSLETDAMAAAAALASQNYIGFIAAGVRMSNEDSKRTDNFRRVVNSTANVASSKGWNETFVISGSRKITMSIIPEDGLEETPYLGLCGMMPITGIVPDRATLMITCVDKMGPLYRSAQLLPGMVIFSVNETPIATVDEFNAVMAVNRPGDLIEIGVISQQGYLPQLSEQTVKVRLASRWQ